MNLREHLGDMDIYLLDQVLKSRFDPSMRILEAGCGNGRNLVYFLRNGYTVFGIDSSPNAIEQIRQLAGKLSPNLPVSNFQVSEIAELPFPNDDFDAIICCAVLHFARDTPHFDKMVDQMWRVLKPGGMLFTRLASTIGIERLVKKIGERWFLLPDGTERFLVDEKLLLRKSNQLHGELLEPLKTTNVQNLRAMTTWVLRK